MPQSTLTPAIHLPRAESHVTPLAPDALPAVVQDPLQTFVAGAPLAVSLARAQAIVQGIREQRRQDELAARHPLARHD